MQALFLHWTFSEMPSAERVRRQVAEPWAEAVPWSVVALPVPQEVEQACSWPHLMGSEGRTPSAEEAAQGTQGAKLR